MIQRLFYFCGFFLWTYCVPLLAENTEWDNCKEMVLRELPNIPGWCTPKKAEKIMDFICEFQPEICVEIGVFAGSTSYPILSALQLLNRGKLYAIDAWDLQAAIEGLDKNDPNFTWWQNVDFPNVRQQFYTFLLLKKLKKWCEPISLRSEDAVSSFSDESIDFLYIDGNFSEEGSLRDVYLYLPKVKKGGYVWLNDANIQTKNESLIFLMNHCQWLKEWSLRSQCIVFKKI